ncbi:MAG: formylglycine-generating enzyme family protein [Bacteroidota bacterium]
MKHALFTLILVLAGASRPVPEGMVAVEGGTFAMGANRPHYEDEGPVHEVTIDAFAIDRYEVTNAQFEAFVKATGYRTDAEKNGSGWVFRKGAKDWGKVVGANWREPEGPGSGIADRSNYPAVQVSWNDAAAYAKWAGKRLPTEAEWEYAARGGRTQQEYPWGDNLKPDGIARTNYWQGSWPEENRLEDGFYYTAPVGSFPANDFGLHEMVGNVWEWCADWYDENYYGNSPTLNPPGPGNGDLRVARGGSWYCGAKHCGAYRNAYRGRSPQDASFNNVGFRCAVSLH